MSHIHHSKPPKDKRRFFKLYIIFIFNKIILSFHIKEILTNHKDSQQDFVILKYFPEHCLTQH